MFRLIAASSIKRVPTAVAVQQQQARFFSSSSRMMNKPFFFTQSHEWAQQQQQDDLYHIGITDVAQHKLGEVIHLEIHVSEGQSINKGDMIAEVESVKAVSEIYAPISGTVDKLNPQFISESNFALLNTSPEVDGWIAQIKSTVASQETGDMLNQESYKKFCDEEDH